MHEDSVFGIYRQTNLVTRMRRWPKVNLEVPHHYEFLLWLQSLSRSCRCGVRIVEQVTTLAFPSILRILITKIQEVSNAATCSIRCGGCTMK